MGSAEDFRWDAETTKPTFSLAYEGECAIGCTCATASTGDQTQRRSQCSRLARPEGGAALMRSATIECPERTAGAAQLRAGLCHASLQATGGWVDSEGGSRRRLLSLSVHDSIQGPMGDAPEPRRYDLLTVQIRSSEGWHALRKPGQPRLRTLQDQHRSAIGEHGQLER